MIGVPGHKLTSAIVKQFQKTHAAGLIVFRPNFKSASAFKKFLSGLEKALGRKLLVAVDHEGGRVIHLAEGITVFPDNWTLGNTRKVSYAAEQGRIEAKELRRLGIDLNLAPTLDVLTKSFSPNIGIRSYGKNPDLVAKLGAARIEAMQESGISACAKHFPGLGAATLDPHLDLPVLGMTWQELKRVHLKPFLNALKAGADCVMSSHPVYPRLDPSKVPATFSRKIIRGFLREKLGFRGVILSDDLEMGALRGLCSAGEAAVRAVEAGHDMVLFCHDLKAQQEAYGALFNAYRSGRLNPENLQGSAERIQNLLYKRARRFEGGTPKEEKQGDRLAAEIAGKGVTFHSAESFEKNQKFRVIFPKLSSLAGKFYIEEEMLKEKEFIRGLFRKHGIAVTVETVSLNPDRVEARKIIQAVRGHESAVFFCYDAHLFKGSREILLAACRQKKNAAVLLRDPYDAVYIEGKIPFVTAYGFRKCQIEAAVLRLCQFMKAGK